MRLENEAPARRQCLWGSERCELPPSLSPDTTEGKWFCAFHYEALPNRFQHNRVSFTEWLEGIRGIAEHHEYRLDTWTRYTPEELWDAANGRPLPIIHVEEESNARLPPEEAKAIIRQIINKLSGLKDKANYAKGASDAT